MSISTLSVNNRTLKVYLIFIHHLNTLLNSFYQLCLGIITSGIGFVLRPAEGRHDVGHFGNAIGRGVFTDAGQLAVIAWMR